MGIPNRRSHNPKGRPRREAIGPDGLTDRQRRFAAEYLVDLNAAAAARRAGYAARSADTQAWDLLRKPELAKAVQVGKARQLAEADLTAARVLEELRRIGFNDPRGFSDKGRIKRLEELTAEQAACVASVEIILKNAKAGDGVVDEVLKMRFWDKPKALDLLARHFALLHDSVEVRTDDHDLVSRLQAARRRTS